MPLGELREVLDNARRISAEVMRPVLMNEYSRLIILILGIAADMPPLLDDGAAGADLSREPLGKGEAGEAGTDD